MIHFQCDLTNDSDDVLRVHILVHRFNKMADFGQDPSINEHHGLLCLAKANVPFTANVRNTRGGSDRRVCAEFEIAGITTGWIDNLIGPFEIESIDEDAGNDIRQKGMETSVNTNRPSLVRT